MVFIPFSVLLRYTYLKKYLTDFYGEIKYFSEKKLFYNCSLTINLKQVSSNLTYLNTFAPWQFV